MACVKIRHHLAQTGQYPPVCMLCAERPPTLKVEQRVELPPSIDPVRTVLGCLLGWIGLIYFLVVRMVGTKSTQVYLVLCDECNRGRKRAVWAPLLGFLSCLGFWFLLGPPLCNAQALSSGIGVFLAILGGPLLGALLYWVIARRYTVTCKGLDERYVLLSLPNQDYPEIYEQFMAEIKADEQLLPQSTGPCCPACRVSQPGGACFCKNCGQRLACGQCGREARAQDAFCAGCGEKF